MPFSQLYADIAFAFRQILRRLIAFAISMPPLRLRRHYAAATLCWLSLRPLFIDDYSSLLISPPDADFSSPPLIASDMFHTPIFRRFHH